jgi:hypothetical protein
MKSAQLQPNVNCHFCVSRSDPGSSDIVCVAFAVALAGARETVLLVALRTVVLVVGAVVESMLTAVVGLVDHGMP